MKRGEFYYYSRKFRSSTGFLFFLCLILVFFADLFFYDHAVGWTASAYIVLLTLIVLVRSHRILNCVPGWIILLGIVALTASLIEDISTLPVLLSVLGIVTLNLIDRGGWKGGMSFWNSRWRECVGTMWMQIYFDFMIIKERGFKRFIFRIPGTKKFWLWIVPVLLSLIFVWLFSMANPIIDTWISNCLEWLEKFLLQIDLYIPGFPRVVFWCFVACVSWSLLRFRPRWFLKPGRDKKNSPVASSTVSAPAAKILPDSCGFVIRCLLVFNLVFAVQTVLDVFYFWYGSELPQGMTYAEYAHRGAYPLVAVSILSAIFILATFRSGGAAEQKKIACLLVFFWLAQNVFLTVSAFWRLWLYIDVYMLTKLRVAAGIWMILIICGLIFILWRIVKKMSNEWLVRNNFFTALFVLYISCFINFSGLIAQYNVDHCKEITGKGSKLDFYYLRELGPDSLPALRMVSEKLPETQTAKLALKCMTSLEKELEGLLSDWRGWTLKRSRLSKNRL